MGTILTVGEVTGGFWAASLRFWLRELISSEIFFTGDGQLCVHVCGEEVLLEGRKMRTEEE